jgi:hypothetical protein
MPRAGVFFGGQPGPAAAGTTAPRNPRGPPRAAHFEAHPSCLLPPYCARHLPDLLPWNIECALPLLAVATSVGFLAGGGLQETSVSFSRTRLSLYLLL